MSVEGRCKAQGADTYKAFSTWSTQSASVKQLPQFSHFTWRKTERRARQWFGDRSSLLRPRLAPASSWLFRCSRQPVSKQRQRSL